MVTINLTEEELRIIQDSLEFYSRLGCGQMRKLPTHPTYEKFLDRMSPEGAEHIISQAIPLLSKGRNLLTGDNLKDSEYYNIDSTHIPERVKRAYDMFQVIRHELWRKYDSQSEEVMPESKVDLIYPKTIKVKL